MAHVRCLHAGLGPHPVPLLVQACVLVQLAHARHKPHALAVEVEIGDILYVCVCVGGWESVGVGVCVCANDFVH